MVIEGYAPEHWGTQVITSGRRKAILPVFSAKMIRAFLVLSAMTPITLTMV